MISGALAQNVTAPLAPLTDASSRRGSIAALPTATLSLISLTTLETVPLLS
jgi:hypothetical protein